MSMSSLSSTHLDAFIAVARLGNFTKAAESLHVTQSALSQRILNLEEELGTTLFIRDRAGLKLTEAALQLVQYCQIKSHLEEEFLHSIQNAHQKTLKGLIRIGGFSSVTASILVPLLTEFSKKHPGVRFQVLTREFDDLFQLLKSGQIDYMILDDRLDRDELERVPLGKEQNFLTKKAKAPLEREIYLDHDEKDEVTLKYLKQFKMKSKEMERFYLDDIYGLLEGVKNGLGMAVLPKHLIKHERAIEILHEDQCLEIPVYLYFFTHPYYSKLHHEFLKTLEIDFKARLT